MDGAFDTHGADWARHGAFLRRLARSLVRSDGDADDLTQDALVAALERPPRGPNVRGWLGTVLVNVARQRARSGARRDARERESARPEALPSDADVVERLEWHRVVAEEVLALPEPYRTALHLRYFEGRSVRAIAAAQRVPLETARTRHKRALALLRERLDRRAGERSRWLAALVPLAGFRPPCAAALKTSMAAGAGAIAVGTKTKVVAAGVVLALGGTLWVGTRDGVPEPTEAAATERDPAAALVAPAPDEPAAPARGVDRREAALAPAPPADESAPAADDGLVAIEGTLLVVDGASEIPFDGDGTLALVSARADGAPSQRPIVHDLAVVAGRWTARVAPESLVRAGPARLGERAAEPLDELVVPDADGLYVVRVRPLVSATLHVLDDATGAPLDGVDVRVRTAWRAIGEDEHPGDHEAVRTVVTDVRSPVALPAEGGHRTYWARAPGYAWGRIFFDAGAGGERSVRLVRGGGVRVNVAGELPEEDVFVRLRGQHDAPKHDVEVRAAADGDTLIADLLPGRYVVHVELGTFHQTTLLGSAPVEVVAGAETRVVVPLDSAVLDAPLPRLRGTLRLPPELAEAGPLLRLDLVEATTERRQEAVQLRGDDFAPDPADPTLLAWDAGEVAPGLWVVTVFGVMHRVSVRVAPAGTTEVHVELPPLAEVLVRVRDAATGEPLRPRNVSWCDGDLEGTAQTIYLAAPWDREREAYVLGTVAGSVGVSVRDVGYRDVSLVVDAIGGRPTEVVVELERASGVRIRLEVAGAAIPVDHSFWFDVDVLRDGEPTHEGMTRSARSEATYLFDEPGRVRLVWPALEGYRPLEPTVVTIEPNVVQELVLELVPLDE